jgi:HSP20 family protein
MTDKRTRPVGISRHISTRHTGAAAGEPVLNASGLFKQFFDRLEDVAATLAAGGQGAIKQEGEIPFGLGEGKSRAVFGYTVRLGLDGLRAERFGDAPEPAGRPSQTDVSANLKPAARAPIVDIFDEGGQVRVVAELPGASAHDVMCTLDGNTLQIETTSAPLYRKALLLPVSVDPNSLQHSCYNGILEVRLRRDTAP